MMTMRKRIIKILVIYKCLETKRVIVFQKRDRQMTTLILLISVLLNRSVAGGYGEPAGLGLSAASLPYDGGSPYA